MKSELLHLLEKLKTDHPDFKALMIFRNGSAMVVGNQSSRQFANLDAIESYMWPVEASQPTTHERRNPDPDREPPSLPSVQLDPPATSGYIATPATP
jgi:hypothetical protein